MNSFEQNILLDIFHQITETSVTFINSFHEINYFFSDSEIKKISNIKKEENT